MRNFLIALLIAVAAVVCVALFAANTARADDIRIHYPTTQQIACATNLASINGADWYFTGVCASPAVRQTRAILTYVPPGGRIDSDVTLCDSIMGRAQATDPIVAFPGRPNAAPVINNFGRNSFISCKFTAPTTGARFGWWKPSEYNYSFDLTSSISSVMGDFAPTGRGCTMQSQSGQNLAGWHTDAGHASLCLLVPGATYYMNFRPTNPQQVTAGCPLSFNSCVVGLTNNFGS